MPTTVHRPLKFIAFSAGGIERQTYEVGKHLKDLKINLAMFSETHLKPHMRIYIPNYDIYQTDREDERQGGTVVSVRKGIAHICIDLPLPSPVSINNRICIPIGNIEVFLSAVYKYPQRLWSDRHHRAHRFLK
jgi:hypothetical protein